MARAVKIKCFCKGAIFSDAQKKSDCTKNGWTAASKQAPGRQRQVLMSKESTAHGIKDAQGDQ